MHTMKGHGFVRDTVIWVAVLVVSGLQLNGQRPNPRTNEALAAEAAAKAAAEPARPSGQTLKMPSSPIVGTFISFDVPGAVNGFSLVGINDFGTIAGGYRDNIGSGSHGFIRPLLGSIVEFDVPGAVNGTFPGGINDLGVVTGGYGDNIGSEYHGFIRTPWGSFVTFDIPPGVCGTSPAVINARGEIAGEYWDANCNQHLFLREPNGEVAAFDLPDAVNGSYPTAISPDGVILGVYWDANYNRIGFRRDRSGELTEITGPGGLIGQVALTTEFGAPLSINSSDEIAGTYFQPISGNPFGGNYRAFLLFNDGQYTTFDAADYPPCCIWSSPTGINAAGTVSGNINDGFGVWRGFVRTPDGAVTLLDFPGAGTSFEQGTVTIGITSLGIVAGVYVNPNDGNIISNLRHGFVWLPPL